MGPFDNQYSLVQATSAKFTDIVGDISGGDDLLGDRDCFHHNINGTLNVGSLEGVYSSKVTHIVGDGGSLFLQPSSAHSGAHITNIAFKCTSRYVMHMRAYEVTGSRLIYYLEPSYMGGVSFCTVKYAQLYGYHISDEVWFEAYALLSAGNSEGFKALILANGGGLRNYESWYQGLYYYNATGPTSITDTTLSNLRKFLLYDLPDPGEARNPEHVFADMTHDAVQNCQEVDVNGLSIIDDLVKIKKMLPPLPSSKKDLLSPKYLSQVYLWFKYGFMNTYRDTLAIVEGVDTHIANKSNEAYRTLRRSSTSSDRVGMYDVTCKYQIKIRYSRYDNRLMKLVTALDNIGVLPNSERAWDLIPFSFCVDWFVSVSDALSCLDDYTRYQYFDVWCVTKSSKKSYSTLLNTTYEGVYLWGEVEKVQYVRYVQDYLDLPPVQLQSTDGFGNYAEATALILANK